MRRQLTAVSILTLASAVAVAAQAQDSTRARVRSPRSFTFQVGPDNMQFDMRRGRLGITVDLRPDEGRDSVGARVSGVTPGGPADHAGVQTGDLITRLNGTRLAADGGRSGDDEDQSRPGMRLINLASRLEAGDTVRLDVRRGTQNLTLSFVADRTDMDQLVERMRIPGGPGMTMHEFGGGSPFGMDMPGGNMRIMVRNGGIGDLEMVKVTPQLAEGLGISEGVLVVSVDSGSTLGLRAGDVITSIAGRRPTDPVHAMRILSSYDPGESVNFDVMRQRRRATVTGRIPDAPREGGWRVRPNNFEGPQMRDFMREMPRMRQRIEGELLPKMRIRLDGRV